MKPFTDAENREDSGMQPGEQGEPYTQEECRDANQNFGDPYACGLIAFQNRRIERLAKENATLRQEVEITRKLNEALRSRKHDQKALQAAILERCNVAIDIVELQQAMQDARVGV